jgi:hypothetical protein
VLTAGHCLVNFELKGSKNTRVPKRRADLMTVIPARNFMAASGRRAPFGEFGGIRMRVSAGWELNGAAGHDFGLITLNRQVDGMNYWGSPASSDGVRATIHPITRGDLAYKILFSAGYPGDKCEATPPIGSASPQRLKDCQFGGGLNMLRPLSDRTFASTQWRSIGRVRGFDDGGRSIEMRFMGATGGQSGSPVWIGRAGSPNLVGVLSTNGRAGDDLDGLSYVIHLSPQVIAQLRAWMFEDGVQPTF